ncbi:MAG: 30S ribosomal protein S5 [Alphaproteobacteria bacterium]|nr:30S ribosomal protein S5 [Alphaproteobacteria bacterium]OJV16370.1 MAG: 30S ribosomal protein S5 [Alphaproteobacteria bacterium 33-17]
MAIKKKQQEDLELKSSLVQVKRVTKVVKGGRIFTFSALVVVGDGRGNVGFGIGKGKEVMDAKSKATSQAKKNLIKVSLRENRTIHHDIVGKFGASSVVLRSAPPGTGIIAGGPVRTVLGLLGIHDVVGKSLGSTNANNIIRATFDALQRLGSPKNIAEKRNKKVGEIVQNREATDTLAGN